MNEGPYRFRVSDPRYTTEVRPIRVVAGQTTELQVRLVKRASASAQGGSSPIDGAERAAKAGFNVIRRVFQ